MINAIGLKPLLCVVVVLFIICLAHGQPLNEPVEILQDSVFYTPTKTEWTALYLQAHWHDSSTIRFFFDPSPSVDNTILLNVIYTENTNAKTMNELIEKAKSDIKKHGIRFGMDSVKIKVTLTLTE